MKKIITAVLCAILFSVNTIAFAEISLEKKNLITTLLNQTGQSGAAVAKQLGDSYIQQMTAILRQSDPNTDPRAFTILEEEITAIIKEALAADSSFWESLYPVYDKHFSTEEIKKMIEFNNTDVGKKIIQVTPLIAQESMLVGQDFGQSIAPEIQRRLEERFTQEGIF